MSRLVIDIQDVEKSYLSKKILAIEELKIYEGEKIGIIGRNGTGKSTLLRLINGEISPDAGRIDTQVDFHYYSQIEGALKPDDTKIDAEYLSRLQVPDHDERYFSGGEQTRLRLAEFFSSYYPGLLVDEPTTHLDGEGIQFFVDQLKYYYGTLLVVRSVLHQLGFEQEEVSKKTVENLSGGEVTRLVIAKLFTDPSNVLVLDEPTNFIDIDTIQALESLMKSYEGTILFTSHDRYFLENTAQQIWRIEDKKLELLKY